MPASPLEYELARGENQHFDLLFIDAFSGDSIPIHLLTVEAFEVYLKHLSPDGVLAVHITNLHLDFRDPSGPSRNITTSILCGSNEMMWRLMSTTRAGSFSVRTPTP